MPSAVLHTFCCLVCCPMQNINDVCALPACRDPDSAAQPATCAGGRLAAQLSGRRRHDSRCRAGGAA